MGHAAKIGKTTFDLTALAAEATRQSAVSAAAQSAVGQNAVNAAEIAYARAMLANCDTNNEGFGKEPYVTLLNALGVF